MLGGLDAHVLLLSAPLFAEKPVLSTRQSQDFSWNGFCVLCGEYKTFLFRGLLTPQQHYDWGLRALKTVLKGCGDLLKKAKKEKEEGESVDETVICVQALRLNTLSKLTFLDMQRFEGIIRDVFPGIEPIDVSYEQIENALKEACDEMNLQFIPRQVSQLLILSSMFNTVLMSQHLLSRQQCLLGIER